MDNRPVGVFDSGVGGLTVMAEIMRLLPHEDIVYFGDTAHVPYGSKSKEVVTGFSLAIASFLLSKKVKTIVVACNTASAFALPSLRKQLDVPVIGVIEPGARASLEASKNSRIGVIGTEGTVRSLSYTRAIDRLDGDAKIFTRACPLFVPIVEEGWVSHPVARQVAREYLAPLLSKGIDTLVLGCTHYPLLRDVLGKIAGPRVTLVDSATATAKEVAAILARTGLSARRSGKGTYRFFVSDAPGKFKTISRRFLGYPIRAVRKVDLEK